MRKLKKAFTLVEIMIVVAIIAILAGVAIPNLLRARVNAHEASAKSILKTVANALESYYAINNLYPSSTSSLMGSPPPYLNKDFFTGNHGGYAFTATLTDYTYDLLAVPVNTSSGASSFTMSTGQLLSSNP